MRDDYVDDGDASAQLLYHYFLFTIIYYYYFLNSPVRLQKHENRIFYIVAVRLN